MSGMLNLVGIPQQNVCRQSMLQRPRRMLPKNVVLPIADGEDLNVMDIFVRVGATDIAAVEVGEEEIYVGDAVGGCGE